MTDDARADLAGDDEDRLPWLEAVEEDEDGGGPSAAKLIAYVVIGLVAIGLVVGGLFWVGNRSRGGDGEIIAAPEGDYKVKPDQPGGMRVEGQGDTAHAASQGAQPSGRIDSGGVPEQPAVAGGQAPTPTPPPAQQTAPAQTPPAQPPAPAPAAQGATIQLGAFSSQAAASRAWSALAGRFRYLAPLSHSVVPIQVDGRTLYRLRASGEGAADICRRLRIAGEACTQVN